MQSVLLYPRRSRFAPNLLKNSLNCILTPGPANVNKGGFLKSRYLRYASSLVTAEYDKYASFLGIRKP
jgi:hypothetical protein